MDVAVAVAFAVKVAINVAVNVAFAMNTWIVTVKNSSERSSTPEGKYG